MYFSIFLLFKIFLTGVLSVAYLDLHSQMYLTFWTTVYFILCVCFFFWARNLGEVVPMSSYPRPLFLILALGTFERDIQTIKVSPLFFVCLFFVFLLLVKFKFGSWNTNELSKTSFLLQFWHCSTQVSLWPLFAFLSFLSSKPLKAILKTQHEMWEWITVTPHQSQGSYSFLKSSMVAKNAGEKIEDSYKIEGQRKSNRYFF